MPASAVRRGTAPMLTASTPTPPVPLGSPALVTATLADPGAAALVRTVL